MATPFRQDLPPPDGYRPIQFHRIPAKKYFNSYAMFAGYMAFTTFCMYFHYLDHKKIKKLDMERNDILVALEPLLLAERDRSYLKQLRRNRDEEAELMKDVPGWKVGTYYGEPLYKTLNKDTFMDPIRNEYYAHSKKYYLYENAYIELRY